MKKSYSIKNHGFAAAMIILLPLSGCALQQPNFNSNNPLEVAQGPEQTAEIHTDLVRGMLAQGKYYAALAHLDELNRKMGQRDEFSYLRAEALAELGRQSEAEKVYKGLLRGKFAAEAYHGLALINADSDPALSMSYFQKAAKLRPTSATIRNDLGYALLLAGRRDESRIQFATAFELAPDDPKGRNNHIMMLLIDGREKNAMALAHQYGLSPNVLANLRHRAAELAKVPVRSANDPNAPLPDLPAKDSAAQSKKGSDKTESDAELARRSENEPETASGP